MKPKLVLLPGTDGTGDLFNALTECLEMEAIVISYPSDRQLEYSELEEYARARLPTSGPFVILGESFSGPVAVGLAQSQPPGLAGLILCASFVVSPASFLRIFSPILRFAPVTLPSRLLAYFLMGRFSSAALLASTEAAIRSVSPSVLRGRIRSALSVDYRENLRNVTVPALYLRATEDRIVSERSAKEFAQCCVQGKVIEIEAPHFLLQCCPKAASLHIHDFASG